MITATLLLAAVISLPKIDIEYGPRGTIFDRACGTEAPEAEIIAAAKLRPELEGEWAREGPAYLNAAFKIVGKPFPYQEMQAVLTVCHGARTMSQPLMINVRQYLAGAEHPAPKSDFSEKLFHELMHHYVGSIARDTPMIRKYAAEPLVVINHLHVVALEKVVLAKLGKTDELKFVEQEYLTSPQPAYKRAWEIVTQEGPEKFIDELRARR